MNSHSKATVHHIENGLEGVERFIDASAPVLLSINVPFLPICQEFAPIFEQAAKLIAKNNSNVTCAKVDAVAMPALTSKFNVTRYPTIVLCDNIDSFKQCKSALQSEDIAAFVQRQTMPIMTTISGTPQLEELRSQHTVIVAAFLDETSKSLQDIYKTTAADLRDEFVFCLTSDAGVAAAEGVSVPSVVVYKSMAEHKTILDNVTNHDKLKQSIQKAARPLVMQFHPELHQDRLNDNVPLGYIFLSSSSQRPNVEQTALPVARAYKETLQLGTVDEGQVSRLTQWTGVSADDAPALMIHVPKGNLKYMLKAPVIDAEGQVNTDKLSGFIDKFTSGVLEPTIKSQPIPQTQQSPVIEVVGQTYRDIVLDMERDVLVEFYTQTCGPCKALLPELKRLAGRYHENPQARGRVTIAKIDFENNDVPDLDIRGFPTFKLYPAGDKEQPRVYMGRWRMDDWAAFIYENGSHHVQLGSMSD